MPADAASETRSNENIHGFPLSAPLQYPALKHESRYRDRKCLPSLTQSPSTRSPSPCAESAPPYGAACTVDSAATLADLHVAIQVAMGWTNSHLHMFITENGVRYGDPTHDDDGFLELDDEVVLEQVHTHDNADALPRCIDAQGRWPASSATDSFACSERHCSRALITFTRNP